MLGFLRRSPRLGFLYFNGLFFIPIADSLFRYPIFRFREMRFLDCFPLRRGFFSDAVTPAPLRLTLANDLTVLSGCLEQGHSVLFIFHASNILRTMGSMVIFLMGFTDACRVHVTDFGGS